jgi:uncharacterized protein YecE (DUF72 family)
MMIRVGTSGWQYADWRERFYPPRLPQRQWLDWYVQHFDTVEVNSTFYRLPTREVVQRWADSLPDGFCMAIKASRYLTHVKRLVEPEAAVERLLERVVPLRERSILGPVLLQLPPAFAVEVSRLEKTLACLAGQAQVAVEPRDRSWFCRDVAELLTHYDVPLVWADRDGRSVGPLWTTASWRYLRLHHGQTGWSYERATLRRWAGRLAAAGAGFVYANNDPGAAAIQDARRIRDYVEARMTFGRDHG